MSMPARLPVIAGRSFAIVGAMLLGATALMWFSWTGSNWLRVLIVLLLFGIGVAVNGGRTDRDYYQEHPVTRALGVSVRVGIGASATFLGAYLVGPLILSFLAGSSDTPPSAIVVILLVIGVPLLALLRFALRDMRVGVLGGALLVPVLGVTLLAQAGATASTVAIVAVVVALAMAVLVLVRPKDWPLAEPLAVLGAMASSFAVGAGTSAVGSLAAQQQNQSDEPALNFGTLPPAPQVIVLAIGLLVALCLVLVALARHQLAGGLVAGSVLAVPPTSMVIRYGYGLAAPSGSLAVLFAIPAIAVIVAAVALFAPATRRTLRLVVPAHLRPARPVVGASALRATIGVALVALTQAIPLLGYAHHTQGIIMAVLFVGAAALAWWVPGYPGALLAAVVLVGLQLNTPWWRLAWDWGGSYTGMIVVAVIGLLVSVAAVAVLLIRHPRPAVFAAAAYVVAGTLASLLAAMAAMGAVQYNHGMFSVIEGDIMSVAWFVGPLVLLGIPAAVAALRGRGTTVVAAGQAVGTVVLAAGSFALARMLLPASEARDQTVDLALGPLIPTEPRGVPLGFGLPATNVSPLAAVAMFVIAIPLLVSTIRRSSAVLTVSGLFVVVESVTVSLVGLADNWSESSIDTMIWVVAIFAVVASAVAFALLRRQAAEPDEVADVADVVAAPSTPTAP